MLYMITNVFLKNLLLIYSFIQFWFDFCVILVVDNVEVPYFIC